MSETGTASKDGRRPDRAALVIGAALLAAAAIVAWDAASIRAGVASYSRIGPAVFPYAVAVGLGLLGLATLVSGVRYPAPQREPIVFGPVLWIVGGLLGQLIVLSFAGFSLATGLVFAATAAGFGRKKLWITYPIGVVIALAVWLVFAIGLKLVLPAGPIEVAARDAVLQVIAFATPAFTALADFVRSLIPGP